MRTETVAFDPILIANDRGPQQTADLEGVGIALVPEPYVVDDSRAGRVRVVFPEWQGPSVLLSDVFQSRRGMTPKLRAFLNLLVRISAALSDEPRGSLSMAPGVRAKTVRRKRCAARPRALPRRERRLAHPG